MNRKEYYNSEAGTDNSDEEDEDDKLNFEYCSRYITNNSSVENLLSED